MKFEYEILEAEKYCFNVTDGTHDSPKKQKSGKYLITSKHIKGREIDYDCAYLISEEDYNKINIRSKVDKWDVLISMIGAYCGFCYVERNDIIHYSVKNVGILKTGSKQKAEWIYYYLNSPQGKNYLESIRAGSTQPYISLGELRKMPIPVPSDDILSKILFIMNSIDEKIELNNKLNDNLANVARLLFKEYFVLCAKEGLQATGKLSDLADIVMGQSPSSSSYNEDGHGKVFYQGRAEFGWRFPTSRLYTTEPKRMAKENAILMSVRAPVGDMNIANENCCIGRGLAAISSKNNKQSYLIYLMDSLKSKLDVYNGEGTVFGSINKNSLANLEINLLKDDKMEEFEKMVEPIDKQIRTLSEENARLAKLRDTLLPKLMSGEIDLDNFDLNI